MKESPAIAADVHAKSHMINKSCTADAIGASPRQGSMRQPESAPVRPVLPLAPVVPV